jgi:hypothetical protein
LHLQLKFSPMSGALTHLVFEAKKLSFACNGQ